jgi:hypothetical protein
MSLIAIFKWLALELTVANSRDAKPLWKLLRRELHEANRPQSPALAHPVIAGNVATLRQL